MSPLIKKEIRLLLPAWIAAMVLAIVPCWVLLDFDVTTGAINDDPPLLFIMLGMLFLGITSFGNEINFKTFPLLLSQPVSRNRIWRVKISLLGLAFLSILGASIASWSLFVFFRPAYFGLYYGSFKGITLWASVLAFFSGGLWATLLLRQTVGAFWVALFTPIAISEMIDIILLPWSISDETAAAISSIICAGYAIAGLFYARYLFLRAQDTQWSGGEFYFAWRKQSSGAAGSSTSQFRRNWLTALVLKEFQLHQVNLLIAAVILILNLFTLLVRKVHPHFSDPYVKGILEMIWTLWLLMPLLIGCSAAAEERKLGILESQLCLPVSRRVQMFIKLFVTMVLGLVLGALAPSLIEGIKSNDRLVIFGIAVAIFFISFYASSLSRTTIQAIGVAIPLAATVYFYEMATLSNLFGFDHLAGLFLEGLHRLSLYLGAPILLLVLGWLALWNFKWLHPGALFWRRNVLAIVMALAFTFILINGIYFRAWELLEPLQPPPGPVRLTDASQVKFSVANGRLYAILPDGRLWQSPWYNVYSLDGHELRFDLPDGNHDKFIGGSNWSEIAADEYQEVGVRSEGSLWNLQRKWDASKDVWHQNGPIAMTQIGQGTNWSQVASSYMGFLLLKKDRSLWMWGTNSFDWLQRSMTIPQKLKLDLAMAPVRISDETNWTELVSGRNLSPGARQNDGTIWHWTGPMDRHYSYEMIQDFRLDKQWSSFGILGDDVSFFGVKTNGELWLFKATGQKQKMGIQLGRDYHWRTVGFGKWDSIMAIREDGTLWKWPVIWRVETTKPVQLGEQSDWIGLTHGSQIDFALAADGNVWAWNAPSYSAWLAPSRRPAFLGNIFQATSESP